MLAMEHRKALILNSGYVPIAVKPLRDAIGSLFSQDQDEASTKILCPETYMRFSWHEWEELRPEEGEDFIRGVSKIYRVPEIFWTKSSVFHQDKGVRFSRKEIYKRDKYQCKYCGKHLGAPELTIDHVIPKSQGGPSTWTNCVLACVPCNSKKANRTPEQAGMKLLCVPKKPRFTVVRGDRKQMPKSWDAFISEAYWEVELENDN